MDVGHATSLLLFALGAFVVPLGAGPLGIPAAVGEILYGVIIGPHVGGLFHASGFSTALAELGFCFLMFLAGLELDFSHIARAGWRTIALCAVAALLVFAVSLLAAVGFGYPPFLLLAFGAMSMGILLATLTELGLTKTLAGQTIILVGSMGEFLTIVLLTGLGFYYRVGFDLQLVVEMVRLAAIFAVAYLLLVALRMLIWWWPDRFARMVRSHDPAEVGVRAAMAVMLAFVALAALVGVEPILGAFVAGALFSFVFREKGILETKLASVGFGFFVPLFFVWVGTEFDVAVIQRPGTLAAFAQLFGISLLAKGLPALLLLGTGLRLRESLGAALLLAAPLTLLVAISRVGVNLKVIDEATGSALVLLAVGTGVLLPPAFRALVKQRGARDA